MTKLLTALTLILATLLFPPAVLALISNNAVPGDMTYPIKRKLEDGIVVLASLNPTTRAWFSTNRSDRRFQEFSALISRGKSASSSLTELVSQTDEAASQIAEVSDTAKKQDLINQLSDSIKKYDQRLENVYKNLSSEKPKSLEPETSPTVQPTSKLTPKPTPSPGSVSPPAVPPKVSETPKPLEILINREEINHAKGRFEEIRKKLEEEKRKSEEMQQFIQQVKQENNQQDKELDKRLEDESFGESLYGKPDKTGDKTEKKSEDEDDSNNGKY